MAAELLYVGGRSSFIFHFPRLLPRVRIAVLGHVFKNFGIGMGLHVASSLAQEFILDKFTSKGKH